MSASNAAAAQLVPPAYPPRWHDWLLIVLLSALGAVNLLGAGSYKGLVYLIAICALVKGVPWLARHPAARVPAALLLAAPLTFIALDALTADAVTSKNAVRNLLAFGAIAAAISLLPVQWSTRSARWLRLGIAALLTAIAVAHGFAMLWLDQAFGLFHNPHFVALGAVTTVPVLVYVWRADPAGRPLAALGVAAAATNLVCLQSIIGWLSLGAALVVCVVLRLPPAGRRIGTALVALTVVVVVAYPPLHRLYDGPTDWVMARWLPEQNRDERFGLWRDAWNLQLEATSGGQWLVGHGLGGFEAAFDGYSRYRMIFPHHFLLEVQFNSGLLGLLAFTIPLGALGLALRRRLHDPPAELPLATALLIAVGAFCFLTLPIAARPTSHLLGLVVGFTLWTLRARVSRTVTAP